MPLELLIRIPFINQGFEFIHTFSTIIDIQELAMPWKNHKNSKKTRILIHKKYLSYIDQISQQDPIGQQYPIKLKKREIIIAALASLNNNMLSQFYTGDTIPYDPDAIFPIDNLPKLSIEGRNLGGVYIPYLKPYTEPNGDNPDRFIMEYQLRIHIKELLDENKLDEINEIIQKAEKSENGQKLIQIINDLHPQIQSS